MLWIWLQNYNVFLPSCLPSFSLPFSPFLHSLPLSFFSVLLSFCSFLLSFFSFFSFLSFLPSCLPSFPPSFLSLSLTLCFLLSFLPYFFLSMIVYGLNSPLPNIKIAPSLFFFFFAVSWYTFSYPFIFGVSESPFKSSLSWFQHRLGFCLMSHSDNNFYLVGKSNIFAFIGMADMADN